MATPKVVTDASSDLDEAVLNLFLNALAAEWKINVFGAYFTAATNAVTLLSADDTNGEVDGADLTWDVGNVRINIALTGFTNAPMMFASMRANASTNVEKLWIVGASNTQGQLSFVSNATPGVAVDPDGDMVVYIVAFGK